MIEVRQTEVFAEWFAALRDEVATARIAARIARLQSGLFGDVQPIGAGLSELRIHHGPGYRLYLTRRGQTVVILLCGGDKSSQARDIERAHKLVKAL